MLKLKFPTSTMIGNDEECSTRVLESSKQLDELRNRKNEQQERMERAMKDSFAQIEACVNCLMQMIQQQYVRYEEEFGKAACALEEDLVKQSEAEKKLLMIASIINSIHESSVEGDQ